MAKFLTTKGVAAKIEDIIRRAKKKVVIVSPFLQISDAFFQRLIEADSSGIVVYIVYGKDDLTSREWDKISRLNKVELFFLENLHAKCYFNESEMVISSMNFYEYSEQNNIEMGISISRRRDSSLYDDAIAEVTSILKRSKKQVAHQTSPSFFEQHNHQPHKQHRRNNHSGVCIRCKEEIPFNPDRPYCRSCFSIWFEYENYDFTENYCHRCGNHGSSTMNKPLCPSCFFS